MSTELERWLSGAGKTLDNAPDAPRGLYERLKYIAELLKDCDELINATGIIYRVNDNKAFFKAVNKETIVGREPPSNIVIDEARLSGQHFKITPADEEAFLEDIDSRNGTYVNGRKITSHSLKDGDVIEAGHLVFVWLENT